MSTAAVILCLVAGVICQDITPTPTNHTHHHHENPELENWSFGFDSATESMVVLKGNLCYIFSLTDSERNAIHTDSGMRSVELRILNEIDNAYYTVVPKNILHTHILKECGQHVANYYLVH